MRLRLLVAPLVIAALAAASAGCGGTTAEPAASAGTETRPVTTTTGTTTVAPTTVADPLAGAGTDPVEAAPVGSETALLERVAVGRHEGYDRVVFQFRNALPGYRVEYAEPPLHQDGSGDVVPVQGDAFLTVRMEPASGFDASSGDGTLVYTGPPRIDGAQAGASVVQEVARIGDFEAVLSWAIGLSDRVDFRVSTLDAPPRLLVDLRNH
jgi:hypothetical protein